VCDPTDVHAVKRLSEHLADYRRYLTAKGNTPGHVDLTDARIRAALAACKFVRAADVQPSAVLGFLAELRRPAPGPGKSIATANYYLVALRGFTRWLWKDRRIAADPLAGMSKLANANTDVRRVRRELAVDELRELIETTGQSPRSYRGLTGPDRAAIYSVAVGTGFRAAELASLTPEDFNLCADPPTIRVAAGYSKNRREAIQPIPLDLAALLRRFLAHKPTGSPVWPGDIRPCS
jgi:site-specific recombinase XerC